jgi:hypothetical protein
MGGTNVGFGQGVGAEDAHILPRGGRREGLPIAVCIRAGGFCGLNFGVGVLHGAPFNFFFSGRTFPAKV